MLRKNSAAGKIIILFGIGLLVGFGSGYYYGFKQIPKTESEELEQTKKNVTTTVKETVRPDGTKETVTFIVDKTKESSSKNVDIVPPKPRTVTVSGTVALDYRDLTPVYGVLVQKPFYAEKIEVGLGVDTRGRVQATLGWNF